MTWRVAPKSLQTNFSICKEILDALPIFDVAEQRRPTYLLEPDLTLLFPIPQGVLSVIIVRTRDKKKESGKKPAQLISLILSNRPIKNENSSLLRKALQPY